MILFLLVGSIYLQAQPPYETVDQTVKLTDEPDPGTKDCTSLDGITQVCEDDGTVTLSFYISNNSSFPVHFIRITGPNGWFQNIPTNLPPNTSSNVQVSYPGAVQGSIVCFDIKLYNPNIGICCHEEICIRVEECPCGTIGKDNIECLPTSGTYEYCFEINNPAYSNNTIDQLTLFTNASDVCLNGTPLPTTISIPAIAPGNTGTVCVVFSGCNSPLSAGDIIDFTIFLEDTGDLAYCCHLPAIDIVLPDCCDVQTDCSQFTFTRNQNAQTGNLHSETFISGVTATVNFCFDTQSVTDDLTVSVNGTNIFTSGDWSTDGPFSQQNQASSCFLPAMGIYSNSINIVPCDVVVITIIGDSCPYGFTGWDLDVTCNTFPNCGSNNSSSSSALSLEAVFEQAKTAKRIDQVITNHSLKIFPNPVQDVLTIQNTDTEVSYETVNILDGTGKVIRTENMSGNSSIRVDMSSLPRGIYFIDAMDSTGNNVTERFVKVN